MIAKALDKSPDRRFATCEELIQAARVVVDAAGPLAESSATAAADRRRRARRARPRTRARAAGGDGADAALPA